MRTSFYGILLLGILAALCVFPGNARALVIDADSAKMTVADDDSLTMGRDVNLKEIQITGQTVKHRGQLDSHLITKDLKHNTTTISEVIGRIPGMKYDHISRAISYMGSSNIKILVDSIEKDEEYIKALTPDRFQSVQVITNPSGKYEGYTTLINLKTYPNYHGVESFADNTTILFPTHSGPGNLLGSQRDNVMIGVTYDKWNFGSRLTYNLNQGSSQNSQTKEYTLNNLREILAPSNPRSYNSGFHNMVINAYLTVDYLLAKNHTLSAAYWFNYANLRQWGQGSMDISDLNGTSLRQEDYESLSRIPNQRYHNVGLYYKGKSGQWDYSADASYFLQDMSTRAFQSRNSGFYIPDDRRSRLQSLWGVATVNWKNPSQTLSATFAASTQFQISHQWRLGSGVLLSSARDNITRGMFNLSYYPSQKVSMGAKIGLQYRHASAGPYKDTHVTPRMGGWIMWRPSSKIWMRGWYNADVTNPSTRFLQDYGQFTDSLTWTGGNPNLRAFQGNYFTFDLGLFDKLTIRAAYQLIPHNIQEMAFSETGMRPDGIDGHYVKYLYQNTYFNAFGFGTSLEMPLGKKWRIDPDFSIQRVYTSFRDIKKNGWTKQLFARATYMPDETWTFSCSYYIALRNDPEVQALVSSHSDRFNLSANKTLFNGRLTLNLTYTPPLHFTEGIQTKYFDSEGLRYWTVEDNQKRNNNILWFNVRYQFSRGKRVRQTIATQYTAD